MAINTNFPNVRPSLLLDFANAQQLDSRVTFSRSTTAPYYDGKTSVLAEQNLLLQSQTFTTTWSITPTATAITANTTTAPDGTSTASLFYEATTATGFKELYQAITSVSGSNYTFSIYAKASTSTVFQMFFPSGVKSAAFANFDLSGGVLGTVGVGCSATITSVGNSWYRCTISISNANSASSFVYCCLVNNSTTSAIDPSYAGTVGNGVYFWGSQLEQRSSVTAYNATTTTAITNYIPQLLTAPINSPRFDFNPTTGESLGLLIEQSSTNLLLYSEQLDNATWSKIAGGTALVPAVTANQSIAPDGNLTADLVAFNCVGTATSDRSILQQAVTVANTTSHTISFWLQAADSVSIGKQLRVFSDGITSSSTIVTIPSTRTRFTITGTTNTTSINISFETRGGYTTNTSANVFLWGCQLEALAFPTSYIPTTSAQVTRASDNASMTGTNVSSWYNIGQGTWYSEFNLLQTSASWGLLGNQVGSSGRIIFGNTNNINSFDGTNSGTFLSSISANTFYKVASTCTQTSNLYTGSGNAPSTTTTNGNLLNTTTLYIGNYQNGANFLNGRVKKIAYYPQAVTSAQLQALTGT